MGIEVGGLLGLIWLIIVIWAIVKVAKSGAGGLAKLIWILVLLFFPLVGLIAWFLFGPKGSSCTPQGSLEVAKRDEKANIAAKDCVAH